MGVSFSYLAVRGGKRDSVLGILGLRGTGIFEEIPESDITGAALPTGWYLILADRDHPPFMEGKTLARLSAAGEVLTWFIEEHVMCSYAALWSGGRQHLSVAHFSDKGINHLKTEGDLPLVFGPIRNRLSAMQQAAGGAKAKIDHIFDIPVELVEQLTGYRHDRVMPVLGDRPFEVLATTEATPKRSWMRRLLGV
jgi:hypothetical protein